MSRIVVIGAGTIGLAIAWRLAERGHDVTVFDRGAAGGEASSVAGGMLAIAAEADPHTAPLAAFRRHSGHLYPGFVRELEAASGMEVGFEPRPTLEIACSAYERERLHEREGDALAQQLPARWIEREELRTLEPALAPSVSAGLVFPHDHAIHPARLARALAEAARRRNVAIEERCAVRALEVHGDAVAAIEHARGRTACTAIVLAAGAWSGSIAGIPPACRPAVRPVRGQILTLAPAADAAAHAPIVRHVVRGPRAYLVPRSDGSLVVGATSEEKGYVKEVTVEGVLGLLHAAFEMVPGVVDLVIQDATSGLRPASRDGLPILGPCAVRGLFLATGHYRSGILLAPATAEALVAWIEGREPGPEASRFAIERDAFLRDGVPQC